jgi:hypothetical protein
MLLVNVWMVGWIGWMDRITEREVSYPYVSISLFLTGNEEAYVVLETSDFHGEKRRRGDSLYFHLDSHLPDNCHYTAMTELVLQTAEATPNVDLFYTTI